MHLEQKKQRLIEDGSKAYTGSEDFSADPVMEQLLRLRREMADEAQRELIIVTTPPRGKARLKRWFWSMAGHPPAAFDPVFWTAGMLLLGLWEAGCVEAVQDFLDAWIADGAPVRMVDDALTGYVLLRMYESLEEKKEHYRTAADAIWHFLEKAPKDKDGCLIYYPDRGSRAVFADGIGQSAMFLSLYGRLFQVPEAIRLAREQLLGFYEKGIDRNTGLLYHGYDPDTGTRQGIIGWGRAMGWILMGWAVYMTSTADATLPAGARQGDTLAVTKNNRPERMQALFRQLSSNALRYLRRDHLFSWQLECMDGPADTSATAMIAWALRLATQHQIDCGFTRDMEIELLHALIGQVNGGKIYSCSAECIDFSQYPQRYGSYPWGQGAALAYLGACIQNGSKTIPPARPDLVNL